MPTALIKDCRFFVSVCPSSFEKCPMPISNKISPQLVDNLTEILPESLPNVGKV
ncbi:MULTISPECIES: hypothetical protein [unclassified Nostoc]|uniref:hypothetical protein n=1 Tax=unclassified Nostoc TaxID=2593658 RepID=UPI0026373B02|nr:hypothetical protein [Nostoc sp. S13]